MTVGTQANGLARIVMLLLASIASLACTAQQCESRWLPGPGYRGVGGSAQCMTMWDPDGPGPRTPVLVIAGTLDILAKIEARGVGAYDPATKEWLAFGDGLELSYARAVAVRSDNSLIVAGSEVSSHGTLLRVKRWDGAWWSLISPPLQAGSAEALTCLPNGDVIVGGQFSMLTPDGTAINVARWDGTSWHAMGAGLSLEVRALALTKEGRVFAGTEYTNKGPDAQHSAWLFDGVRWNAIGTMDGPVHAAVPTGDGGLYVGGRFTHIDSVETPSLARLQGDQWISMRDEDNPAYFDGTIDAIAVGSNGDVLVVGDYFFFSGPMFGRYAMLRTKNGWAVANSDQRGYGLHCASPLADGSFVVGGDYTVLGGQHFNGLAQLRASEWHAMDDGLGESVQAVAVRTDGTVAIAAFGHGFPSYMSLVNKCGSWDGVSFLPFGSGFEGDDYVASLVVMPNNDVIAGGSFKKADGQAALGVARWDGQRWHGMGGGLDGSLAELARDSSNTIWACGRFTLPDDLAKGPGAAARWDGSAWRWAGAGLPENAYARHLLAAPDGRVYLMWEGQSGSYGVSRWTGSAWVQLPALPALGLNCMAIDATGGLVVGGQMDFDNELGERVRNVARFDGAAWRPLGQGPPNPAWSLHTLATGAMIANAPPWFDQDVRSPSLFIWHGDSWEVVEGFPRHPEHAAGVSWGSVVVNDYADLPTGAVVMAGGFEIAGERVSVSLARWIPDQRPVLSSVPPSAAPGCGRSLVSLTTTSITPDVTFQWLRDGQPFTPDGVRITIVASASSSTLAMTPGGPDDDGVYQCRVSNACGTTLAPPTSVYVCIADIDCDGRLDENDFWSWLFYWDYADPRLDIDGIEGVDLGDFFAFFNSYDAGC